MIRTYAHSLCISDKGLDTPYLCMMPDLIGSIGVVLALLAMLLVFHSMYKAIQQDLAELDQNL